MVTKLKKDNAAMLRGKEVKSMNDEQYINEQFQEMRGLGYTVAESIASLENDENVNQDVLKEMLKKV
jgi:hypothetical protein